MDGKTILADNRSKMYVDSETESDFDFQTTSTSETIETDEFSTESLNNFTYQDLRETINVLCDLAFKICFISYGILQFFAISSGLLKFLHSDNIFVLLISSVLAFLPVIGSLLGAWGACVSWGWGVWNSIVIFFVPYVIINGPIFMIILFEYYKDIKRWQKESGKNLMFPLSVSER